MRRNRTLVLLFVIGYAKLEAPMAKQKPLSKRQKAILVYIEKYVDRHGYPPTIREIGAACDIPSTSVVNYNLNRLEREGLLVR